MSTIRARVAVLPRTSLTLPARPTLCSEWLILLANTWFVLVCNTPFWASVQQAQASFGLKLSLGIALIALHTVLFGLFLWGRLTRPLLVLLMIVTSLATWYMTRYAVVFDVDMLRNVLQTDPAESRELLSLGLFTHVLLTGIAPGVLLLWVRQPPRPWRRALRDRMLLLAVMTALALIALVPSSQGVFALMRNDHALRYRITPGNYLVSLGRTLAQEKELPTGPKRLIAADAVHAPTPTRRPRVVVLVIGETVRGDHWGLNGYERQTTPVLATRTDVVNFPDVSACGTSTAISLPCMFSMFGREHYDRIAIGSHQSVLDVLLRVGVGVLWRDNQAGCKGVCDGVDSETMSVADVPQLCEAGRCLDEILLHNLSRRIEDSEGDQLIVLHQLGNHGPNYFERYPAAYEHWKPVCRNTELSRCSQQEIVNAYDNAILYTDAVLGGLIDLLAARSDRDSAMVYLSDHGESLGEYGLFLHGAPYAIAPRAQLHVPMALWMSRGFTADAGIDTDCLRRTAQQPISHDHLFSTLLGLFDVQTSVYRSERDALAACRMPDRG